MMTTYYDILGIAPNASKEDIKKAYRKLSIKFHPDKNDGDVYFAQMFRQVNEAYNTLINDEERIKYESRLRSHEESKSNADKLKNLERELAYKEQLLKEKERDSLLQRQRAQQLKSNMSSKLSRNFLIKIKHIKYLLWVVIIGFVIAIGKSKPTNDLSINKTKPIVKKHKKVKHKKKLHKKTHTVPSINPMQAVDTVEHLRLQESDLPAEDLTLEESVPSDTGLINDE